MRNKYFQDSRVVLTREEKSSEDEIIEMLKQRHIDSITRLIKFASNETLSRIEKILMGENNNEGSSWFR